jgi:hypothetical protein
MVKIAITAIDLPFNSLVLPNEKYWYQKTEGRGKPKSKPVAILPRLILTRLDSLIHQPIIATAR